MHCTDQAPLSYALPNEEPAGHLNADDHIYGSLERENKLFTFMAVWKEKIKVFHIYGSLKEKISSPLTNSQFLDLAHCPVPESLTL